MTAIAEEYVALAVRVAAALGSPRVRAFHLPPLAAGGGKEAEFCALELDDGAIGFSYVRLDGVEPALHARRVAGSVAGVDALSVARGYAGHDPAAKALGFAAINALSQALFARAGWTPPASGDSIGDIEPAAGEHIGMIGLFSPLVERVRAAGARLTVLELRPELAGERDGYRVTLDPSALAGCDKVLSTCTVMLNDTLDDVLAACARAQTFAMIGPTAGCLPDPLFRRGVTALGGRRVVDPEGFLAAFRAGGKWGAHAAKYTLRAHAYPGLGSLIERVR